MVRHGRWYVLGWSHAADENPQGSKQIQVDGQAFGGTAFELDGTDNQDAILGIIVINPNSESMSEAKLATIIVVALIDRQSRRSRHRAAD